MPILLWSQWQPDDADFDGLATRRAGSCHDQVERSAKGGFEADLIYVLEFRRRWSSHDVRLHAAGTKRFHHAAVGDLELAYESVEMFSDPGLSLTIYAAEPASRTAEALALLASWAATPSTPIVKKSRRADHP